ncbi:MAG: enoyl-CoA hydratase/isomerase family protein [Gammaproteobacteria bacterium]|nr:enoyl-CoA hydratase/isomerase family protein [Gammaproteobacteria bacterium]
MSVDLVINDAVAEVTLDNSGRKNAISMAMRQELQKVFLQLQDDEKTRAIVISGAGADFSAGSDLKEMGEPDVAAAMERIRLLQRMLTAVAEIDKPVIAAVQGVCIGASWSLALAADFIIAAEDARFQFSFGRVGLAPDCAASHLLARHVGLMRAKEIVYSGRTVSGNEAAELGLALEAIPGDQVLPKARAMAATFAKSAALSLTMAKRQFGAASAQTLSDALALEANMHPLLMQSEDFREGKSAFSEKRAPLFKGK